MHVRLCPSYMKELMAKMCAFAFIWFDQVGKNTSDYELQEECLSTYDSLFYHRNYWIDWAFKPSFEIFKST